jgi:hypothetical protein
MKMNQGSGTISDYGSYVNNCVRNQAPYKIPVNTLDDVQLYIDIGGIKPTAVQYQLIHTCGALSGTIEAITPSNYVVGQDPDNYWYGVFKNFTGANPVCFVITITLTISAVDYIYFSDEYCVEQCRDLTLLKSCYGNLDGEISTDCQDIYFGVHSGEDIAMGDTTVFYEHKALLRDVEVSLQAIKNTFKQGRTRTFRTEKDKIFQFLGEFIPEWYMYEIDSIFSRGEVFIGTDSYLVNETQFEKIEDCKRMWKPTATLKESCYQSFSCEVDPCSARVETCCDPSGVSATVEFEDSGAFCCDPEIINAQILSES